MNIKQKNIQRKCFVREAHECLSLVDIAVTNATTRGRCVHTLTEQILSHIHLPLCCHKVLNHVVSLVFSSKINLNA